MGTNITNLQFKDLELKFIELVFDKLIYLIGSYLCGYFTYMLNFRNPEKLSTKSPGKKRKKYD